MASKLYNLARMTTATTGTGTITLGSAVSGYLSFSGAGIANGDVIAYAIKDGTNSEIGTGTYTSAGTTLTRTVTKSTNSNTAISLSGTAEVFITPRAEDLLVGPGSSTSGGIVTFADTTGTATSDSALTIAHGTWTPSLKFGGASTGMTYAVQAGQYTKIGNMVLLNGYFQLSAKGSSTGSATITGMPFTGAANVQTLHISSSTGLSVTGPMLIGYTISATSITLQQQNTTGGAGGITDAAFTTNTDIGIQGVYFV